MKLRSVLLVAVAVAGCGNGRSLLSLTVTSSQPLSGIDRLQVVVADQRGDVSSPVSVSLASQNGTLPPAKTIDLGFDATVNGTLDIDVRALDIRGAVLTEVHLEATVRPSQTERATANLLPSLATTGDMAGSSLTVDSSTKDFGTLVVGTQSLPSTLTVSNAGLVPTGALTIDISGKDAASFVRSADKCTGQQLDPGAQCTLEITFAANAAGPIAATLEIDGTPGGTATVALSGSGVAAGSLSIVPSMHDFGAIAVDTSTASTLLSISNSGSSTGTPQVSFTGSDADQFKITSNSCTGPIPAGGACTVAIDFAPSSAGAKTASLLIEATPGGAATAALSGSGRAPAQLTLSPATHDFMGSPVGVASPPVSYTLTNVGGTASGPIATSVTGNAGDFVVTDSCKGTALDGGSSCTMQVVFKPVSDGKKTLSLAASASPGGTPSSVDATGEGLGPLVLTVMTAGTGSGTVTSMPNGISCGATCSGTFPRTSTVILTATPAAGSALAGWSGACAGATGNSCSVVMSSAQSVTATFSPAVTLAIALKKIGAATGSVTSAPSGINCGSNCSAPFAQGSTVTLTAAAGSGYYFNGWTGACSGNQTTCSVTLSAAASVGATFAAANLVFVTTATYSLPLGTTEALTQSNVDLDCDTVAHNAGFGGTYVAWISTTHTNALDKLSSKNPGKVNANGWVIPNGRPFASSSASLASGALLYSLISESSTIVTDYAYTGTGTDGTLNGTNCSDFTNGSGTDSLSAGLPHDGGYFWTLISGRPCSGAQMHLYCFETDFNVSGLQATDSGRYAFVSLGQFSPGGAAGAMLSQTDTACSNEASAHGLPGNYKALIGTTTQSAEARGSFSISGLPWSRPDHVLLAETASDFMTGSWIAAPTLTATNVFVNTYLWVGSSAPAYIQMIGGSPDPSATCDDWTSTSSSVFGINWDSGDVTSRVQGTPCNSNYRNPASVLCVQQ